MLIHLIPEPLALWLRIRLHVQLIRNVQIVETVHDIGGINGRPFCGQHRIVTARRRRTKKRRVNAFVQIQNMALQPLPVFGKVCPHPDHAILDLHFH